MSAFLAKWKSPSSTRAEGKGVTLGRPDLRSLSVLLFLFAGALYAGSLRNGFHFDDFHAVVHNPHIRELSRIPTFFRDPATFSVNPESAMYRPLLLVSLAVDHALFGERPWGYHLVNAALHAVAAVLVLHLVAALGCRRAVAAGAALIFAGHPVNSEAVAYVSSRSEVLMGVLFLGGCLAYLRYRDSGAASYLLWCLAAALGGLLSKSVAIAQPAALALLDGSLGGWRRVRRGLPVYLLVGALGLLYMVQIRQQVARAMLQPVRTAEDQWWTQLKAGSYYAYLGAMPVALNVEHQFEVSRGFETVGLLAGCLLLSAGLVAFALRRQLRWPLLAGGWWALLLLPSAVVPLIVLVNEHRLYTASAGLALATATSLCALGDNARIRRRQVAAVAVGLYTCVLATLTVQRVRIWDDELTLWADSARKSPGMLRPHLRLADALVAAGRPAEAEAEYLRALVLRPLHPAARNNLGRLYQGQGRFDEAEAQYRALLDVSPDNVPSRMNLADLLLRGDRWQEAGEHYRQALRYGDTQGRAQARLGHIALGFEDDPVRAIGLFDEALRVRPADVDAHVGRGMALRRQARLDEAAEEYLAALTLDSTRVDALFNLGALRLEQGRPELAREALQRVIDLGHDPGLARAAAARIAALRTE